MKPKIIKAHMQVAEIYAKLSSARKLQVGCVIVKDDKIISIGYNGMPTGWDNNCEDKEYMSPAAGGWLDPDEVREQWPFEDSKGHYKLTTKLEVIHAEANALVKVARSCESTEGATLFVTHSPCMQCAKLIYQSGIKQVFYRDNYHTSDGINFLKQTGITITKLEE